MANVFLSLGSNINRDHYISAALDALHEKFGQLVISSVYESEAVGFDGDNFYNLVVGITTNLSVGELSQYLKGIEDNNHRDRSGPKFSGRTLDLDILTYDHVVGHVDGIELPRGEITENAFVLWPLAEIGPTEHHPQSQISFADLWSAYTSEQKLWPIEFIWNGTTISPRAD